MPELTDPPDAPEAGSLRIKPRELVNLPIILLPLKVRIAHDPKKDEDFEVVDCHFWRLESSGVVQEGETGISWWKAREQLRNQIGQYIACRPRQGDDNSISLIKLEGAPRDVAAKVIADLSLPDRPPAPSDDYSEEPPEPAVGFDANDPDMDVF